MFYRFELGGCIYLFVFGICFVIVIYCFCLCLVYRVYLIVNDLLIIIVLCVKCIVKVLLKFFGIVFDRFVMEEGWMCRKVVCILGGFLEGYRLVY